MNNEKKEKEVTLLPKVIILLTLGFVIKLLFSCTPYSQDPIEINYNNTSMFYAASFLPDLLRTFSFQAAQADDVNPSYIPRNKVVEIKVKTLLDINGSLKAGDDISEHILCNNALVQLL